MSYRCSFGILAILCCLASAVHSSELFARADNPWQYQRAPKTGPAQVFGDYTAGCLQGAVALPLRSKGYRVMNQQRRRYFGHPELIRLIQNVAEETHKQDGRILLVGDLSQARGGPTMSKHQSHQTGLDADIWFLRPSPGEVPEKKIKKSRSQHKAFDFVDWPRKRLKPGAWTPAQTTMLELIAKHPSVERVLVNPLIKRELCRERESRKSWLGKIRPWWGHGDHLHLRLSCPPDSPECKPQGPAPEDPECGPALDWWFTAEADAEFEKLKYKMAHPTMPTLPQSCRLVLQ